MWRRVGYPITKYANTVQCNLVLAASTWENGRSRRRVGDEVNKFKIWIKLKTTKSLRPQLKSRHFCAGESCPAHNVLSLCDCIAERLWGLPTHPSPPVPVLPDRWVYTSLWASIDYMLHFNNWSCFPTRALNKTNCYPPNDVKERANLRHHRMFLLLLWLRLLFRG